MTMSRHPINRGVILAGLIAAASVGTSAQANAMNLGSRFNVTTTPHGLPQLQSMGGRPPGYGSGSYEAPPLHPFDKNTQFDGIKNVEATKVGRIHYGTYQAPPLTHTYDKNANPGGTTTSNGAKVGVIK